MADGDPQSGVGDPPKINVIPSVATQLSWLAQTRDQYTLKGTAASGFTLGIPDLDAKIRTEIGDDAHGHGERGRGQLQASKIQ